MVESGFARSVGAKPIGSFQRQFEFIIQPLNHPAGIELFGLKVIEQKLAVPLEDGGCFLEWFEPAAPDLPTPGVEELSRPARRVVSPEVLGVSISRNARMLRRPLPLSTTLLRLTGSLLLGRVPATGIMRTLQVGDNPTRLAQAIAEFGRIDKTLHTLNMIDDENKRRSTLTQLNRGEGRHSLGRAIFHGKRGELRQRYREGQEDQLGALGLVVMLT
jgi:hypothetical protein